MPQAEFIPLEYKLVEQNGYTADNPPVSTEVNLRSNNSDTPFLFTFQAIRPGLFRTTFSSSTHPLPPHPSAARPEVDFGTLSPTSQISKKGTLQTINVGDVTATVDWEATPVVTISLPGQKSPLFTDLPFRSYTADGNGIAHYSRYKRDILHVGLGEKAAPMNLSNRSFALSMTDCFGYDVYRSDPLYKQIPLLISASPEGVVGTFSTSHSRGMYSVGAEIDGMWGHFKVYRQDFGGLEEYTIIGKTIKEVVKLYANLVGYPKLVPRWAFGYIAGGYRYAALDEPRACDALMDFSDKLLKYDIPCSAMQMSSGYTIAETVPKNRHVFTWNRHRFPDPEKFLTDYRTRGIRLIANVKPYVLATHPEYKKLVTADAFFKDPITGKAGETRLWSAGGGESDIGSHIDFTSKGGFQWWYDGVKSLRKAGIEGIWNDNNEYTIPNDHWQCACDSDPETGTIAERVGKDVGIWGRSVNTELMGKSSHDALVEAEPEERPFVLTRAATAGTMRYTASSWSGDNVTSWPGMKGANSLSLNAGMSLLQCYGHDIGGFEGPQPTPELLLRWVQLGVHSSRFAINCFKTDKNDNTVGGVIEPWMYPEIIPNIREIIKRRYELMPYVYSLALESHLTANPPQKWTGFGYESDPEVWTEEVMSGEEQFWLGDTLLVGGVYKKGSSVASMYLPTSGADDEGYLNINAPHQYISAGKWVDIESPWNDSIPILARVGGAIPVGKGVQTRAPGAKTEIATHLPEDDYRGIEIFPPSGSSGSKSFSTTWYEDDGISAKPKISNFTITYSSTENEVVVKLISASSNEYKPVWSDFSIILPFGDKRTVVSGSTDSTFVKTDESGGRSAFKSQKA